MDVFSATFARLTRKEGSRYIVVKVRMQIVISSEWPSASRDVSKRSDCLIINETAVVNAHPVQNINSEFTEFSIGTDGISQDEVCQWTPTPADAWKDQERSLPSWQRSQQQLPETVILCGIRSPMQISTCRTSVQHMMLYNRR